MISRGGVTLRPVTRNDEPDLRLAEIEASISGEWRLGGTTPSDHAYPPLLWNDVLAQFLVVRDGSGRVHGLVSAYGYRADVGVLSLGVTKFGGGGRAVAVMFGAAMFVDWLFQSHPIRKIRIETPAWNVDRLGSLVSRGVVRCEGRYENEVFRDGSYWDVVLYALWREDWLERRELFLGLD